MHCLCFFHQVFLCVSRFFVPRRSYFHSFSLLTELNQLTEGNDNEPESFFSPLWNGFKFFFANQHKFKKIFHHSETSSCVSRAIAKRSNWVVHGAREGAKRQCYVAVTLAIFPVFFPESLSYHSKLKWVLFPKSQSRYYASSTVEQFFSIGESVPLWVE